jgi:hypothetical protein
LKIQNSKIQVADPGVYDRHGYDREKREALESWARRLLVIISDLRAVTTDQGDA